MLFGVVGVPELAGDPEVLAGGHEPLFDGELDPVTDLFLVTIIACAVQVPVASTDGLYDNHRGRIPRDFPHASSNGGHRVPRPEHEVLTRFGWTNAAGIDDQGGEVSMSPAGAPKTCQDPARWGKWVPSMHGDPVVDEQDVTGLPRKANPAFVHEGHDTIHGIFRERRPVTKCDRHLGVVSGILPASVSSHHGVEESAPGSPWVQCNAWAHGGDCLQIYVPSRGREPLPFSVAIFWICEKDFSLLLGRDAEGLFPAPAKRRRRVRCLRHDTGVPDAVLQKPRVKGRFVVLDIIGHLLRENDRCLTACCRRHITVEQNVVRRAACLRHFIVEGDWFA
mmetsp:Transcript_19386/g.56488  ORF Transcript_19386/g.56488 Transcript_19386/m.56488 type:complete len:336 (-) Transcript_19386:455-1462(-)